MSGLDRAFQAWRDHHNLTSEASTQLWKKLSKSHTIYGTLLVFPDNALSGPEWHPLLPLLAPDILDDLWQRITKECKITHIASNKPIPPHHEDASHSENILRAPVNFTPVFGDFGPECASQYPPTTEDFAKAFWVTAKQNGIYQTWAPRWTMFSRGNISEKARLLTLPSVIEAAEDAAARARDEDDGGAGCDVVDLYAGIGYFAFSYAKAGARRVFCWDLNPWSVEGLVRGARKNKWDVESFERMEGGEEAAMEAIGKSEARFIVFNESNEWAPKRLQNVAKYSSLNIRHVNLGMLPSSRKALELAAAFVSLRPKGWLHVHENFLVEEIAEKSEETRKQFEQILLTSSNPHLKEMANGQELKVEIEYINKLKSYAPGVMHCVIDISVEITG
ncbi:tRNA wybutosine-synthesizing protein 2 [Cercospora zeina]